MKRLRPAASPSDDAIADYYRSTSSRNSKRRTAVLAAPSLAEVEGQIREILVQKRINELLDQWIEDLKTTTNVRFILLKEGCIRAGKYPNRFASRSMWWKACWCWRSPPGCHEHRVVPACVGAPSESATWRTYRRRVEIGHFRFKPWLFQITLQNW